MFFMKIWHLASWNISSLKAAYTNKDLEVFECISSESLYTLEKQN